MRDELASAIRRLNAPPDNALHASYVSPAHDLCDIENVLFYNVGTSAFRAATTQGMRFERSFAQPPVTPTRVERDPRHYHRYEMRAITSGWSHWLPTETAVEWQDVEIPRLGSDTKTAVVWHSLKRANGAIQRHGLANGHFGLRIVMNVPDTTPIVGVSGLMKPLLDGLIAAFHRHDGSDLDEIARRLAQQLDISTSDAARLLSDAAIAALGERRLVWLRGVGLQWNPRDDDCVAAEVIVRPSGRRRWTISGSLFEVAAI